MSQQILPRNSATLSANKLEEFLAQMLLAPEVAIDTETNGEDVRDGRGWLQGISVAFRNAEGIQSGYFPFRHEDVELPPTAKELVKHFLRLVKVPIFHNSKFDLQVLLNEGIDLLNSNFQDTMLMAHLINENFPIGKSLEMCARMYLGIDGPAKASDEAFKKYTKKVGWVMPAGMIVTYARVDAELTLELYEVLSRKQEWRNLSKTTVWETKQDIVRLIRRMESVGVKIETTLCKRMVTIGETTLAELEESIGGNLGSNKFLTAALIDELQLPVVKTSKKTGKPSFDKEAMEEYDLLLSTMDNTLAKDIFAHRGWTKSVSSNYRAYLELLSPDGRLRPNFKMHGTRTGRLSCEKPNLQQIPRVSDKPWNGKMKQAFIPKPGFTLIEADYSQLELRLATAYGEERELMTIFNEGRDVFTEMANELGMKRQDVKTLVYSIQYGAGIPRIMHVFGVSEERAAQIRAEFYDKYKGFRRISEQAKELAKRQRKVPIWTGRFRHFTSEDNPGKALNAMIQGGAADIMERTMLRVANNMVDWSDCSMLLQVHDSVILEVRNEYVEDAKRDVQQIMQAVEPDFGVKFAVEVKEWGK